MEKKINIAELLKDCPKCMKLDCTIFDTKVIYKGLSERKPAFPIVVQTEHGLEFELTQYGQIHNIVGSKCVIFPKGKTTWKGFHRPFKEGDIVTYKYENGLVSMILNKFVNFVEVHYHCALYNNAKGFVTNNYIVGEPKYTSLATEEEKEKLFYAIKANGYKWNPETKTLEKLVEPKFKVGDRIRSTIVQLGNIYTVLKIEASQYIVQKNNENSNYTIFIGDEKYWELVPNKFDISTLVPFESRVLARDAKEHKWTPAIYGYYDNTDKNFPFKTIGSMFRYCIPYNDKTIKLLGTTNDCDEYYKIWE